MNRDKYKYKEDSTKGSSVLEPRKYKGDALVQMWCDSRYLATIDSWLEKVGDRTRFLSEVVNHAVEVLANHLVSIGEVEMVDDTATARDILTSKFRVNLNPQGRGMKNAMHNLVLSDRRSDLREEAARRGRVDDVGVVMHKMSAEQKKRIDELSKQAITTYNELYGKESGTSVEETRERIEQLKKEGLVEEDSKYEKEEGLVAHAEVTEEELRMREEKDRKYLDELKNSGPDMSRVVSK